MQDGVPLQRRGVPWVRRSNCAAAEASHQIEEEEELGGREKDGSVGDVPVEWERSGEHSTGSVGNLAELGVVARLAGKPGEMHRQERGVGTDEGQPEVPAS